MAIAFANLGASASPDINSGTDATSYANSSWTPPTSGLIVLYVLATRSGGPDTPTVSGNSLTWTQIGTTLDCGAGGAGLSLFGADASGSAAGVTTVSFGGNTQAHCCASFLHATGVDLSGGVAAAFVQSPTGTGTGTTGTVTLAAAASSDNRPIVGFFHQANEAATPRASWTEADDLAGSAGIRNLQTQWRDDAFETTATATWTTSSAWGGIAAELKLEAAATVISAVSPQDAINAFMSLPGLRGFWPLSSFDDNGNALDLSGHAQTLTRNGTPTYGISQLGAGYAECDSGDYFERADAGHYDILGTEAYVGSGKKGLTLGGWFYFPAFTGVHQSINKSDFINNCSYELTNVSSGSAAWRFGVSGDGTSGARKFATMVGTLPTGQWIFLVGRFTPSTEVALFTNKTKAVNTTSIPAAIFNSSRVFRIDENNAARAAMCFLCAEAISDALLDDLYDATLPLFDTGPDVAETITLTEGVKPNLASQVKPSETVTLTESQTVRMATAAVSQNETVTLTETVSRKLIAFVNAADTITVSESVKVVLVSAVSQNETVTLTETVSRNLVDLVSSGETVTLSEAITASMARQTSQTETVTLTETVSQVLVDLVGTGETITLSEAATVSMNRTVTASETVTLSEAATAYMVRSVSTAETVTLAEAQSVIVTGLVSAAETITLSETSTAVLLVSLVAQGETVTLTEGVSVVTALNVSAGETITLTEGVLINAGTTNLLVSQAEIITLTEGVSVVTVTFVTIVIYDTLGLTDVANSPIFSVTDTLGLTDAVISNIIDDTLTLTDTVTIGNVTVTVEDTLTFSEVLVLDGPTVPPPATPATGLLDTDSIVLRLLYGNDRRNPIRTLDIAQLAPGAIRLMAGGFSPGAGERNQLWSGESIRFDGQDLLAESRKNSQLAVTYALKTGATGAGQGSQAALSYFQRQVTRFFTEAKRHQVGANQNHTVWLEYRWPDGLNELPTPTFGQLSTYYEVYSANAPKWPDSLHNDMQDLSQGLIAGVVMEITGSPAPMGLKQRAAQAGGAISLHDKGVLITSGSSSKLHWAGYADSGLTGQFHITGWITLNATWGSGTKYAFDYYVSASNRISIVYDATNTRWTITKIRSGSTFTTNSSSDAVANGDDVHLQLVQDATTLYLYVNGLLAASVTATATMSDNGTISLGGPATGTLDGVDVILDGWRVLPAAITSTQALALYEAELPIKQDGGQVGPPLYFWTVDGFSQVSNCDDSTRNNWGIIGGVGGDIEGEMDIRLQTPGEYSHTNFYYGIRAQDETYTPSDYIFNEGDTGTNVVDATASGGSYRQQTGTSLTFYNTVINQVSPNLLFGKYQLFARLKMLAITAATITPKFEFAENFLDPIICKAVTFTGNNDWQLVDLGTVFITAEAANVILADSVPFDLRILITSATSIIMQVDFLALMPYPYAKLSNSLIPSTTSPFYVVAEDGQGYMYSGNLSGQVTQELHFEYLGEPLTVTPNKYNYLFAFQSTVFKRLTVTDTATLTVYVTPRYLLPGGMVA